MYVFNKSAKGCMANDRMPISQKILMFVFKPNNAVTDASCIYCSSIGTVKLCGVTSLFGIFSETNKHWNSTGLYTTCWGGGHMATLAFVTSQQFFICTKNKEMDGWMTEFNFTFAIASA